MPTRRSRKPRSSRRSQSGRPATRRPSHSARRHGDAFGKEPAATTPEFEEKLASFLRNAQALIDLGNARTFKDARAKTGDPTFGADRLTIERGPRYIRVVKSDVSGASRSAYVFIDAANGDIFKTASWKGPAKHARGNIFDANPLDAITQYGGRYMRR